MPSHGRVTHCAIVRIVRHGVMRILRRLVVLLMTTEALAGHLSVGSICVALNARSNLVRAGEREVGGGVIKRRWLPGGCCVAILAFVRELILDVAWAFRASVLALMA